MSTPRPTPTPTFDAVTLRRGEPLSEPVIVDPPTLMDPDDDERYETAGVLGEGGMGVVYLCRDGRIGRQVALKLLRPGEGSTSASTFRFQREARVQGQLEHPGIVPVYDVGVRADGTAYFTMKRLRGFTLGEVVSRLAAGDEETVAAYAPRRLLGIFSQVLQAIAFAHARGVIHRDIKPTNIMLGAYGEVYVLDWGLAKIRADIEEPIPPRPSMPSGAPIGRPDIGDGDARETLAGEILGTPGYMAPEQIDPAEGEIGVWTDIYALGAMLFEILALVPLNEGATTAEILRSTMCGAEARPSVRAPERGVSPELDDICVRATHLEPHRRIASAAELHALVENYLDGDRDLVRRRKLAADHIADAQRALGGAGAEVDPARRADAMQHLGTALSLDPGNEEAVRALTRLLVSVQSSVPPELRAEFALSRAPSERVMRDIAPLAYGLFALGSASVGLLGVRDWSAFAFVVGFQVALTGFAWLLYRRPVTSAPPTVWTLSLGTIAVASTSAWVGWAVNLPSLLILNTLAFVLARPAHRHVMLFISLFGVLAPFALEMLGVTTPSYEFRDGVMVILPRMTHLPPTWTPLVLLWSNLVLLALPTILIGRVSSRLRGAEEQIFMHQWNLRQLLPETARGAVPREGAAPIGT